MSICVCLRSRPRAGLPDASWSRSPRATRARAVVACCELGQRELSAPPDPRWRRCRPRLRRPVAARSRLPEHRAEWARMRVRAHCPRRPRRGRVRTELASTCDDRLGSRPHAFALRRRRGCDGCTIGHRRGRHTQPTSTPRWTCGSHHRRVPQEPTEGGAAPEASVVGVGGRREARGGMCARGRSGLAEGGPLLRHILSDGRRRGRCGLHGLGGEGGIVLVVRSWDSTCAHDPSEKTGASCSA